MHLNLRGKLTITYALVTFIALLVFNFMAIKAIEAYFLKNMRVTTATSGSIVANAGRSLLTSPTPNHQRWANITHDFSGRALLLNTKQEVLYDSTRVGLITNEILTHPLLEEALEGKTVYRTQKIPEEGRVLYAALPVVQNKEVIGITFLAVNINHIYRDLFNLGLHFVGFSILIALVITALSFIVSHLISDPLRNLTEAANALGEGDLDRRVRVKAKDEIGILAEAFNSMAEHLQQADDSRKEFISNASHELKTPLASMKVLSESLLHSDSQDVKLYREFLGDINQEVNRLSSLVENLLRVAALDSKYQLERKETNIKEILNSVKDKMKYFLDTKSIDLKLDLSPEIYWQVEPNSFQQIMINLIDNSIKYSLPNTKIIIEGIIDGKQLLMEVKDEGLGIPSEALPHILDRFYRVDKDRSRESGGTGLGLSIVKKIMELHNGTIHLKSKEGEGTTVILRFPK